jgi:hypothetical protein
VMDLLMGRGRGQRRTQGRGDFNPQHSDERATD